MRQAAAVLLGDAVVPADEGSPAARPRVAPAGTVGPHQDLVAGGLGKVAGKCARGAAQPSALGHPFKIGPGSDERGGSSCLALVRASTRETRRDET
jgi:hypothetical protein